MWIEKLLKRSALNRFRAAKQFSTANAVGESPESNNDASLEQSTQPAEPDCKPPLVKELHHNSIVAVDCEMVGVRRNISALACCSIVGYNGEVIFHSYIKPREPITSYRTKWSGITPHHMTLAIPTHTALACVQKILKYRMIVGHDLFADLKLLGLSKHPKSLIRDTLKCPQLHMLVGLPQPSLKVLASKLLQREIQAGSHSSLEDAKAVMDIYKTVEVEWEEHIKKKTNFKSMFN